MYNLILYTRDEDYRLEVNFVTIPIIGKESDSEIRFVIQI